MAPSVLIIGASGVLGATVGRNFQENGWQVLGTGCRRIPVFQPSMQLDATKAGEVEGLKKWLEGQSSFPEVAVFCQGIVHDSFISKMDDDAWREVLDVNLKAAFLISQALLPRFMKRRSGHLIFVGSWGGRVGRMGQGNYSAAKAGLVGLAQSMAREYGGRNIQSNIIIPGVFTSPMTGKLDDAARERLQADSILKRETDLDEIARFIVQLAGMKNVTGQVFQLDSRVGKGI